MHSIIQPAYVFSGALVGILGPIDIQGFRRGLGL